jgi:L-fuconolactonase
MQDWAYEDFLPYMEVVCEAFGNDRILLGSDWPVCRLAGSYAQVMGIPLRFFETLGQNEKDNLFFKNAIHCYQLER